MKEEFREERGAQTPEETNQALGDMAARLENMDGAEGIFGESLLDEELDDVAGGGEIGHQRTAPYGEAMCQYCWCKIRYGLGLVKKPSYHRACWDTLMNQYKKDPFKYMHEIEALERASKC